MSTTPIWRRNGAEMAPNGGSVYLVSSFKAAEPAGFVFTMMNGCIRAVRAAWIWWRISPLQITRVVRRVRKRLIAA